MSNLAKLKSLLKERKTELGTVVSIESSTTPTKYKIKTPFGIVSAQKLIEETIKVNDVVKIQNQIIIGRSRVTEIGVYYV